MPKVVPAPALVASSSPRSRAERSRQRHTMVEGLKLQSIADMIADLEDQQLTTFEAFVGWCQGAGIDTAAVDGSGVGSRPALDGLRFGLRFRGKPKPRVALIRQRPSITHAVVCATLWELGLSTRFGWGCCFAQR